LKIEDCKVLVLQKMRESSDYLKAMLVSCGAKAENIYITDSVEVAKTFILGEHIFNQGTVDFIITGIGYSGEIGSMLLKCIERDTDLREDVVVYFYSGGDAAWVMQKVKEYGADGFLPCDVYLLKEKIINVVKAI